MKQERLSHPQAGLIPTDFWNSLFEQALPDYLLPIMEAQDSDVDAELLNLLPSLTTSHRKESARLAIALSHQDLSIKKLVDIGQCIGLSLQEIFGMTILYENLHFLNHLIASQQGLDPRHPR